MCVRVCVCNELVRYKVTIFLLEFEIKLELKVNFGIKL